MKLIQAFLGLCLVWACTGQAALLPGDNDLYIRVVDVGAGLCTITRAPGPTFMVYDAGQLRAILSEDIPGLDLDMSLIEDLLQEHAGAVWSAKFTGHKPG